MFQLDLLSESGYDFIFLGAENALPNLEKHPCVLVEPVKSAPGQEKWILGFFWKENRAIQGSWGKNKNSQGSDVQIYIFQAKTKVFGDFQAISPVL